MINVSPNMREARGSQAQPGHSISQQHSQPESRVPPNEQYRVDPLIARQTGIPSGPAAPISVPSSQYKFVPVVTYVPVPVGDSPSLPPYERSAPLGGAPVSQGGAPSTSGAGISSETRDESNKSSGKKVSDPLFATFELTGLFVLSPTASLAPAVPNDSPNLKGKTRKNPFGESVASESPRHPDGQSQMDRSGEIKRLLVPSKEEATAAVCPPPDDSQSVAVYYNYERARPVAQTISESSSEFQNPWRGNPSDSRIELLSDPASERPTNQSTSSHLANSNVSVTSELPLLPRSTVC